MTEALQYELTQARLDNGLQVVVAPDPDAPGVAVNLWVEVGSADEAPGRTGFAHLFEHLMFQGSAHLASGEHMATVESLGGTVNATTSTDRTNYFETVPRGALELALWMEADRFSSLAITPENFEAQRQVVKEEKRQRYDNQPYGDLLQLLTAQHFPETHPYGHLTIGSMADLDAASLQDVSEFFDAWYRACNLRLVVCGPVGPDEALDLAGRYFADLPALPKPERLPMTERPVAQASTVAVSRQVPHSLAYLSWPTPPASHADQPAIDLALSILADGHSSRLHRALVKHADVANEVHSASLTHRSAASIAAILGRPADGVSLEAMSAAILDGRGPSRRRWPHRCRVGPRRRPVRERLALGTGHHQRPGRRHQRGLADARIAAPDQHPPRGRAGAHPGTHRRRRRTLAGTIVGPPAPLRSRGNPMNRPDVTLGIPWHFPTPTVSTLGSGLTMWHFELPGQHIATFEVMIPAPLAAEPADREGVGTVALHAIDEGTRTHPDGAIGELLEDQGATLHGTARQRYTTLGGQAPSRRLPQVLPLFTEVLSEPTFDDRDVAHHVEAQVAGYESTLASPSSAVRMALRRELFGTGDRGGRPAAGTPATLAAVTPADAHGWHRAHFSPKGRPWWSRGTSR